MIDPALALTVAVLLTAAAVLLLWPVRGLLWRWLRVSLVPLQFHYLAVAEKPYLDAARMLPNRPNSKNAQHRVISHPL